ncbi:MAG: DUF4338 domain-containing protein [Alphaproteobacteria bacterium]|nr:DUF4338 domain-containing protein [Alphaproteobacteria bacterium]
MQIGMRQVSAETVEWFGTACRDGGLTRTALARALCERENRVNASGRPVLASARKLLPKLAAVPGARLPDASAMALDPHMRPAPDFPDSSVACALRYLGALSLGLVTDAADRRRESMIETHHPEGWRRPPGGQVRHWIRSEQHGVPGGIGWSADARVANIGRVVCSNRFLPLGGVRVKGLASRSLRLATARVAGDWAAAYGERLPAIFPGRAEQAAACRLPSSKVVTMEHILESHFERTVERCRDERLVPAVQDTMTLNHDGLSGTSGILAHVGIAAGADFRQAGTASAGRTA